MDDLLPDLCDEFEGTVTWVPIQWQDYGGKHIFSGKVETLRCYEDNSMVRELVASPGEGRILVIDGHGNLNRALLGDLLAEKAVKNGWNGVVVYGAVRDAAALSGMPLGVKALGVCPIKTEKKGKGEIGASLRIGGILIESGNYLYADKNGVVVSEIPLKAVSSL
ncbi:putative 4-hydroxy-4-methyl-2-oxoglutarate aldolase [Enterovibrio sp. ZSDZ35]|uniref:4-hydroxy-4-methyl-2-oxoglutarate aldolase n=1 Tax=Enterovibrio qingdaonensis TaxID=2899818 RepID=A0ABT5QSW1_9GAMM|nr:putative 4-hydroxy-4-methyl-2-oxoglutarate aldolase [Enterovibrio sp. ZSDZ35]MDD1784070.1 putative 4-hydroxy-4-methyl-2-oxoglutarate aldolase [Enterovibrio sp. ZSDZ35]